MTREEQLQQFAEQYTKGLYLDRHNLIQMVKAGAEWADQHPQWIPVEERLPETDPVGNSDYCLTIDKLDNRQVASYNEYDLCWQTEDFITVLFVTHWMPLPPAPRKEDNNA